jgi:ketosteroid isomerase-like protein
MRRRAGSPFRSAWEAILATLSDVSRVTEAEVLAVNSAFYRAFARRDVAAIEALWARTLPVACIHPGWAPLRGRERVLASFRAVLANPRSPEITESAATVHLVGESAFVICYESIPGAKLVATNVFGKEDGAWKLVHHQAGPVAGEEDEKEKTPEPGALN